MQRSQCDPQPVNKSRLRSDRDDIINSKDFKNTYLVDVSKKKIFVSTFPSPLETNLVRLEKHNFNELRNKNITKIILNDLHFTNLPHKTMLSSLSVKHIY